MQVFVMVYHNNRTNSSDVVFGLDKSLSPNGSMTHLHVLEDSGSEIEVIGEPIGYTTAQVLTCEPVPSDRLPARIQELLELLVP